VRPQVTFITQLPIDFELALETMFPAAERDRVIAARTEPGFYASPAFDVLGAATGRLSLILQNSREFLRDHQSARALVRAAAAEHRPACVGLGSYTVRPTEQGCWLTEALSRTPGCGQTAVTHGDAGSAAMILRVLERLNVASDATVAIVGAYGLIGSVLSRYLSRRDHPLILVGPSQAKLEQLANRLVSPVMTTTDIHRIDLAQVVITVTSHPGALVTPDLVSPGATVIDPSIPPNVRPDPRWFEAWRRHTVVTTPVRC